MIWILQNQDIVPAGRYGGLLAKSGHEVRTVMLHHGQALPQPDSGDGLLVLGGTMGLHDAGSHPWLQPLKRFMAEAADKNLPLLGICLGAQLLCAALGGIISVDKCSERGVCRVHLTDEGRDDPLFAGLPGSFPALQWHNDSFDLPAGASCLATSSACPVQAFRFNNAYAVQFHPEIDDATISVWNGLHDSPGDYGREFASVQGDWQPAWDRLLGNFLQLCV